MIDGLKYFLDGISVEYFKFLPILVCKLIFFLVIICGQERFVENNELYPIIIYNYDLCTCKMRTYVIIEYSNYCVVWRKPVGNQFHFKYNLRWP